MRRPSTQLQRTGLRLQADINVTPMVDVMLVLLVIFMVAAPMMAASLKVELPSAATASQDNRHRPVTVSITPQGGIFIGKIQTSETAFAADMKAALAGDLSRPVLINADRTTQHGRVVRVMDLLAQLGARNLGIVADARARPQSTQGGI